MKMKTACNTVYTAKLCYNELLGTDRPNYINYKNDNIRGTCLNFLQFIFFCYVEVTHRHGV